MCTWVRAVLKQRGSTVQLHYYVTITFEHTSSFQLCTQLPPPRFGDRGKDAGMRQPRRDALEHLRDPVPIKPPRPGAAPRKMRD